MENIFYAVLALHIAGKPINKENIRKVLNAAGTPVNELGLEALAAFVEAIETSKRKRTKKKAIDPRIANFLASELTQRKAQTGQLEDALKKLTEPVPPVPTQESPASPETLMEEAEVEPVPREEAAEAAIPAEKLEPTTGKARYIYGIAATGESISLGQIGIESGEVYTIPYKDMCAIVHNCPTKPYKSDDDETVKDWVRTHQKVLDKANERLGTIIPLGFDTIIQPKDNVTDTGQVVRDWLKEDYTRLRATIDRVKGKDEYGIQISYEPKVMSELIAKQSEEVRKIKEEMSSKSPGLAYMYKQKLEKALKSEMERFADDYFKDFYRGIKQYTEESIVEKSKKLDKDKVMLMNLSCLVAKEKAEGLGNKLERINNMEGFSVHFSGPWPPYSFAAKPAVPAKEVPVE
jgi:hypothetical protein